MPALSSADSAGTRPAGPRGPPTSVAPPCRPPCRAPEPRRSRAPDPSPGFAARWTPAPWVPRCPRVPGCRPAPTYGPVPMCSRSGPRTRTASAGLAWPARWAGRRAAVPPGDRPAGRPARIPPRASAQRTRPEPPSRSRRFPRRVLRSRRRRRWCGGCASRGCSSEFLSAGGGARPRWDAIACPGNQRRGGARRRSTGWHHQSVQRACRRLGCPGSPCSGTPGRASRRVRPDARPRVLARWAS